jgi:hypothetical protein
MAEISVFGSVINYVQTQLNVSEPRMQELSMTSLETPNAVGIHSLPTIAQDVLWKKSNHVCPARLGRSLNQQVCCCMNYQELSSSSQFIIVVAIQDVQSNLDHGVVPLEAVRIF